MNMTQQSRSSNPNSKKEPKFNLPDNAPSVKMAVHSPYITGSPFASGVELVGGKRYKIKLQMVNLYMMLLFILYPSKICTFLFTDPDIATLPASK